MPGIESIHDCAASIAVIRQETLRLIANQNEHSDVTPYVHFRRYSAF